MVQARLGHYSKSAAMFPVTAARAACRGDTTRPTFAPMARVDPGGQSVAQMVGAGGATPDRMAGTMIAAEVCVPRMCRLLGAQGQPSIRRGSRVSLGEPSK
jgi:hypothetical protein